MGLFDSFKKEKSSSNKRLEDTTWHFIDKIYKIQLPTDWKFVESDRFRVIGEKDQIEFALTNYVKPIEQAGKIDASFFKGFKLGLYERYINEGGYISYNDLEVSDAHIAHSFKVGEETQYCYTTAKTVDGNVVLIDVFMYHVGEYQESNKTLIKDILETISFDLH